MPPKSKKSNEPSKKTEQKKKDKIIEDKTFGLKNKKGAQTQKYISQVEKQVKLGNPNTRKLEQMKLEQFAKKEEKKKTQAELNLIIRPVFDQKVGKGVDPKSVLCAFFKQGQCKKGSKCKFSHDLDIERKTEKRNIYEDSHENQEDTMANWDETKLEEVVNKKHGESNKLKPATSIICKHFLEAVELSKYGWFWECPSENCHYKHALPVGFVLKSDMKKIEAQKKENQLSLEDLIEKERAALSSNFDKLTLQSFLKWKMKKRQQKAVKDKDIHAKKQSDFKAGKILGISGREMFEFDPTMIGETEEDEEVMVFDSSKYENEEDDVDFFDIEQMVANDLETMKLEFASLNPETKDNNTEMGATGVDAVPIDEDLFTGDDLDDIEQDLEDMALTVDSVS